MWKPDKWQENLLWHFLRTGDYWCGPAKGKSIEFGPIVLLVGGHHGDQPKLYAIKFFFEGQVVRTDDYYSGPSMSEWKYLWVANEHTERYLRWFEDKWENSNIIDSPPRRRRVKECLETIDAYYRDR